MLFSFDCENSFAAHSAFYFLEYWLKWLFKCKRLPTPDLSSNSYPELLSITALARNSPPFHLKQTFERFKEINIFKSFPDLFTFYPSRNFSLHYVPQSLLKN